MDTIALYIVGLTAVGYIAKLIWQELQGKTQCHCSGSCGSNCHKK